MLIKIMARTNKVKEISKATYCFSFVFFVSLRLLTAVFRIISLPGQDAANALAGIGMGGEVASGRVAFGRGLAVAHIL
jgi:hypothetical protein